MNVSGASRDNDALMLQWECAPDDNELFKYDPASKAIKIKLSDKCVDVKWGGTGNGTQIWQHDCNGSPAQQWVYENGMIKNPNSNKCLNVPDASKENGPLQIWDCGSGVDNDKWSFS